jgi:hypothetical protein
MEEGGEVCLEEEVVRLYGRGLSEEEISEATGLQRSWVQEVLSRSSGEGEGAG